MLKRPTAIKLLRPEIADRDALDRFRREVQLTAKLTHPNTVTIYDYGRTPEGLFYYAMELLSGATLTQVVEAGGPQPVERVVRILRDAALALNEAHDVGLIHRDIKPSNIMLARQGGIPDVTKVLDFGLVKNLGKVDDLEQTNTMSIKGTPHYLSPEAIQDPQGIDARTDLYALGAVGYYLLAGRHVFRRQDDHGGLLASFAHDSPPDCGGILARGAGRARDTHLLLPRESSIRQAGVRPRGR